ncbi:MAG TPA: hypothetical protein VFT06_08985 [Flavisolibacter sp.]|nr:hypothetical protein [Flavisolibacter sp.]
MKKTLALLGFLLATIYGDAQESTDTQPNITLKWAPTGLLLGSASLQAEYNFGGKNSLTAKIGLPAKAHHSFTYDGNDADFTMRATSFLAGYRTYFSKRHLHGLYYEPFFKYVHHTSEGTGTGTLNGRKAVFDFINDYNGVGVGVQLGAQFFIGKHVVIDLFFLGLEINSATNSFKTMEISNTVRWMEVDAQEAVRNIREFLDQFPFIRNRSSVMVDKDNKRVLADFKGALPGIRTGVSIGIAF